MNIYVSYVYIYIHKCGYIYIYMYPNAIPHFCLSKSVGVPEYPVVMILPIEIVTSLGIPCFPTNSNITFLIIYIYIILYYIICALHI